MCSHVLIGLLSGSGKLLRWSSDTKKCGLQELRNGFQFSQLFPADLMARLGVKNMVVLLCVAVRCCRTGC